MNLCYIQARGGSKRFPRKNVALWRGVPMVVDAIRKAQATALFDIIAVTSDDTEILNLAIDSGALPIYRSAEASSDTATDTSVAAETLRPFKTVENVCKLYPCIPLLTPDNITYGFYHMEHWDIPGVYSVDAHGIDAGAFYWFKLKALYQVGSIALDVFPWTKYTLKVCQDINTPEDLEAAKRKAGID